MNKKNTLTIVGAGASGLLTSIVVARRGHKVLLIEQSRRVAKKILASGNGRCNITNIDITPQHYHCDNPPFIKKILEGYGTESVISIFKSIGLELVEGSGGKLFPMSMQSSSVVDILLYEVERLGVEILYECRVESITKESGIFAVGTTRGEFSSTHLLLSTGSMASPKLGGGSSGIDMAKSLGHTIIPPLPSLVQLCSDEEWVNRASGVKIDASVKLYTNSQYTTQKRGDILFTNYGISGLAILDISRDVSIALSNYAYCDLIIDILPDFTKEQLINLLQDDTEIDRPVDIWLQGILNKKLIPIIISQSKTRAKTTKELNKRELIKLSYTIKNLKLSISKTRGFESAEVAIGGVDTREIDPETMESKIIKNLYFAGEILDVDGDRGGFNFHFAWVCSMRVGSSDLFAIS
jgi:predicted Rossmann fold flavoprotein